MTVPNVITLLNNHQPPARRRSRCWLAATRELAMAEPAAPPTEDVRAALVKLKGQAHGWTMSEDAKLEACMAAIQSRLEQRSGRLERRLAEFGLDLERTHAKLGNVFNEFDGLSHSQVPTAQPHHNPQPTAPTLRSGLPPTLT